MTATTTTLEVQAISTELLDAHPKNPHGVLKESDPNVGELKALIARHGQTQAGLVRPKGARFEVVIGHRRAFVCELLGIDFQAVVRELADDAAIALMLSDNESHEKPDPFLEAEAVRDLMNPLFRWTIRDVADLLGKPVRWVAQRANLLELSPKVRKTMKAKDTKDQRNNPFTNWPIAMFEEFAKLSQHEQDALLEDGMLYDCFTLEDLSRVLRDQFHVLGKAPWNLADAQLYPAAGACTSCPKTSLSSPGLFDDAVDDQDVTKATCRDGACWKLKSDEHATRAIAAAKEKHPDALLIKHDHALGHDLPESVRGKLTNAWDVEKAKKSTPGAIPAIVVGGEKGPTVEYVLPLKRSVEKQAKASKAKAKTDAGDEKEKLRASMEKIGARRRAFVVDEIRTQLESAKSADVPPAKVIYGLAAAYKVDHPDDIFNGAAPKERRKIFEACNPSPAAFAKEVWPRLQDNVAETLKRYRPEDLDAQHAAATWVAELVGIDAKAIADKAVVAIPDPKWWGPKDKVPTKATPATKTPSHKAALEATPGICRGCRCTHDKACSGGCSWVELPNASDPRNKIKADDGRVLPSGLCSSCAGSQPKGKKKKARK